MSEELQRASTETHEGLDDREKRRLLIAGIVAAVSIYVLLFIIQNNKTAEVSFVVFSIKTSLIWLIVLSLIAGAVLGSALPRILRRRFPRDKRP
jgi:uncharacterized integral membrane protein